MNRRSLDEALDESLQVLREHGHDDLADDLAYRLRSRLSWYQKGLSILKNILLYGILVGATIVTIVGFAEATLASNYTSALLLLLLGVGILVVTALFLVFIESFRDHLEDSIGADESATTTRTRGRV